jgi:hypothetical protein
MQSPFNTEYVFFTTENTEITETKFSISYLKNSGLSSKTEKKSSNGALKLEVPKMTKMS